MFQSATQHFNLFVYYSFFIPIMLRCRISTSIAFAVVDRCFVVKKKVRTVQRTVGFANAVCFSVSVNCILNP
ncbi:hypothetical protein D1609_12950 [Leptospira borgpetersenii serovar Hardjo-bovis]|nr:hypothetical protein B9T54_13010 [Leptospira borgpetersenii serovar Hardjo-bovis]AYR09228.1 hypothetical protein D1609_12950 [Leptospira borgpetersenii serovar Hardjo-bovis]TQE50847.1 hypothetical protein FFZ95_16980 [Leptospira borgpetersenii]